jgi:SAM-dependent methyltransferase
MQPVALARRQAASAEESRVRAAYARRSLDDERYSWFNAAHRLAVQERERHVLELLSRFGFSSLASAKVLEIGCGVGSSLREFLKWGAQPANVTGVDLLADRIAECRRLCPEGVRLLCANAATVDLPSNAFDIVVQSMLFTSVLDGAVRRDIARKMLNVVCPDGLILWYDYRVDNPRNPDVKGVTRREVHGLFPGCSIELRRITLAAPLARMLVPRWPRLYEIARRIPSLRTHYLAVIRKPE